MIGQSVEQRCQKVVEAMWSYYGHENYSVVWEIILCNRNNAPLRDAINNFFRAAELRAEADIQEVFSDLRVSSLDSKEICLFIGAHLRGISLLKFTNPNSESITRQPQYLATLLAMKLKEIARTEQADTS
jgi:hypothetical protein